MVAKHGKRIKDKSVPLVSEKSLIIFRIILLLCTLSVVVYSPFRRGLFFEEEQLPVMIFVFFTFSLFWVYKWLKKDHSFLQTPIEFAAFGFVIVYFLSIFVAVSIRAAILEWLKYCMYFAIFFMLSELLSTYRSRIAAMWTIVGTAIGLCIIGIDGAAGHVIANWANQFFPEGKPIFFGTFVDGRIHSTLQYPNALAAYLLAAYFIGIGLILTHETLHMKLIGFGANFIIFTTFLLTQSRGAYFLLPIAGIILVLMLSKEYRIIAITSFLIPSIISGGILAFKLFSFVGDPQGNYGRIWACILVGTILTLIFAFLNEFIIKLLNKLNWKVFVFLCLFIFILGIVGTIFLLNLEVPLILGHSQSEQDGVKTVTKSVSLEANREYKLVYDVDISNLLNKNYAYKLTVISKNLRQVLSSGNTVLATKEEQEGGPTKKTEVSFKVPSDSKIIIFQFENQFQGTQAIFTDAKIVDAQSNDVIKNLILKYKYIPESIANRFEGVGVDQSGLQRKIYYKDGAKIIKDRWFLGGGGGAWPLLYFTDQSFLYWSTQPHNYFLQVMVECGTVGILVLAFLLISIGVSFLYNSILKKRESKDNNSIILGTVVFSSMLIMLLHSAVDFDLSLAGVFLMLWSLIGVYNSCQKSYSECNLKENPSEAGSKIKHVITNTFEKILFCKKIHLRPILGILASLVILILPVLVILAKINATQAYTMITAKNFESARSYLKKASSLDIYSPEYKLDYAKLILEKQNLSRKDVDDANRYVKRAEELGSFSPAVLQNVGGYHLSTGEIVKGLRSFDQALKLRPLLPDQWLNSIMAYNSVFDLYLEKKDNTRALEIVDKALSLIDDAKVINAKNLIPFTFPSTAEMMLEKMRYFKDNYKLNNLNKLVFYSIPDLDINNDSIPDQWMLEDASLISLKKQSDFLLVQNLEEKNHFIQSRLLSLQPGKKYSIMVHTKNPEQIKAIPFEITGVNMDEKNSLLKPSTDGIYFAEVDTPLNFKSETSYLRLFISGRIEIRNIFIFLK